MIVAYLKPNENGRAHGYLELQDLNGVSSIYRDYTIINSIKTGVLRLVNYTLSDKGNLKKRSEAEIKRIEAGLQDYQNKAQTVILQNTNEKAKIAVMDSSKLDRILSRYNIIKHLKFVTNYNIDVLANKTKLLAKGCEIFSLKKDGDYGGCYCTDVDIAGIYNGKDFVVCTNAENLISTGLGISHIKNVEYLDLSNLILTHYQSYSNDPSIELDYNNGALSLDLYTDKLKQIKFNLNHIYSKIKIHSEEIESIDFSQLKFENNQGEINLWNCKNLKEVKLSSDVWYAFNYTFEGCYNLEEIDLSNVKSIPDFNLGTFKKCYKLRAIHFNPKMKYNFITNFLHNSDIVSNLLSLRLITGLTDIQAARQLEKFHNNFNKKLEEDKGLASYYKYKRNFHSIGNNNYEITLYPV